MSKSKTCPDRYATEMTKREVFALAALQGMAARGTCDRREIASWAVRLADELIEELNRDQPK